MHENVTSPGVELLYSEAATIRIEYATCFSFPASLASLLRAFYLENLILFWITIAYGALFSTLLVKRNVINMI